MLYNFPVQAYGNENLKETSLDAYEVGYTGTIRDRATVTAAFYVNDTKNDIFFTQVGSYNSHSVPPGWMLPPQVLDLLIAKNAFGPGLGLPSAFSYRNFGKVRDKGLELGLDLAVNRDVHAYTNYSYQATPVPTGFDISEINIPAKNRFNAGANFTYGRYLGDLSVSYSGEAVWNDVLDARYHGPTKAYTMVNGGFGVRWAHDKITTSLKVTNIGNVDIQQHVFGDIMKRRIAGELKVKF